MNTNECIYSKNVVTEIPNAAHYVPDFITEEEEAEIIQRVSSVPLPKWTQLRHRRLQNWGGVPHSKGMIAEEIPNWLKKYIDKLLPLNIFDEKTLPNHVLINEYLPGQGIMAHTDGPLFCPVITIISCGSHIMLDFYKQTFINTPEGGSNLEFSFLLERRSLLILTEELYHDYLHSIEGRDTDVVKTNLIRNLNLCKERYKEEEILRRGTRISLTIRHVPKTTKLKLKIG